MKKIFHQVILMVLWVVARLALLLSRTRRRGNSVLLIPADPDHLVGSRGDEAMLVAALSKIRTKNPGVSIYIGCSSTKAITIAESYGAKGLHLWGSILAPLLICRHAVDFSFKEVYLMGADIMDGNYSGVVSLRMVIAADLFSVEGAITSFLGFSINERAATLTRVAFRLLSRRVRVNVRDEVSLARFERFSPNHATLVADTAFLLATASEVNNSVGEVLNWIRDEGSKKRIVIAINFHPILFGLDRINDELRSFASLLAEAMMKVQEKHNVSWLLLPHDDRKGLGDIEALALLRDLLESLGGEHSLFVTNTPSAAELKLIAGTVDGVITGRMHLAIATLGQGRPVLAFAYQGKFEGLGSHFRLPDWLMMRKEQFTSPNHLCGSIEMFVENIPEITKAVREKLPEVMVLANSTFDDGLRSK